MNSTSPEQLPPDLLPAVDDPNGSQDEPWKAMVRLADAGIVGELPSDERADLLGDLDADQAAAILNSMPLDEAARLRKLTAYQSGPGQVR